MFASVYTDARGTIDDVHPDVYVEARVLIQSPDIPNAPIAFGPTFPPAVRAQIEAALVEMADEDSPDYPVWEASMGALYSATGLDDVAMTDFEFVKSALDASGLFDWGNDFAWGTFIDDNTSVFEIGHRVDGSEGITKGCNPPRTTGSAPTAM